MLYETSFKAFLAVARTLNFTKAADELYTTQPTISRQISLLESEWGIQLFERNNKEVRLTPEGAIMLKTCQQMDRLLDRALAEARSFTKDYQGELSIGCLSSMDDKRSLIPALEAFWAEYPNVKTKVELQSFSQLRSGLESGRYDIIFTLDFDTKNLNNVEIEVMEALKCHFLLSDKHPLASKPDLTIQDLQGVQFVLPSPEDSPGREGELKSILDSIQIHSQNTIYAANMESLLFYLNAGKAVALLNVGERNFRYDGYRHIPLPDDCPGLYLTAVWKRDNLNPAIPMFVRGR